MGSSFRLSVDWWAVVLAGLLVALVKAGVVRGIGW